MVSVNLRQACDIVCQVGHRHTGFGSYHADAPEHQSAHGTLDEAEHMLHTAAHLRFLSVGGFLSFRQRMVAIPFLTNYRIHAFFDETIVSSDISCIKIYILSLFIVAVDELRCSF